MSLPKNQGRIWKKILAVFQVVVPAGSGEADHPVGAATANRAKRKVWVDGAGGPSGAAPTGMTPGDFILDIVNDEVYRYISGTTYVNMTADS